jgi:hypothetical protein
MITNVMAAEDLLQVSDEVLLSDCVGVDLAQATSALCIQPPLIYFLQ